MKFRITNDNLTKKWFVEERSFRGFFRWRSIFWDYAPEFLPLLRGFYSQLDARNALKTAIFQHTRSHQIFKENAMKYATVLVTIFACLFILIGLIVSQVRIMIKIGIVLFAFYLIIRIFSKMSKV